MNVTLIKKLLAEGRITPEEATQLGYDSKYLTGEVTKKLLDDFDVYECSSIMSHVKWYWTGNNCSPNGNEIKECCTDLIERTYKQVRDYIAAQPADHNYDADLTEFGASCGGYECKAHFSDDTVVFVLAFVAEKTFAHTDISEII